MRRVPKEESIQGWTKICNSAFGGKGSVLKWPFLKLTVAGEVEVWEHLYHRTQAEEKFLRCVGRAGVSETTQ